MYLKLRLIHAHTYHYTNMVLCNVKLYFWIIFFVCLLPLLSGEYTVQCVIFLEKALAYSNPLRELQAIFEKLVSKHDSDAVEWN